MAFHSEISKYLFLFFSSKGSADSTARSWSFDTGGCLKIFKGHGGAVTTMATDAVGKMLFTAGNEFAFFDLVEIFPKMLSFSHLGADALIKSWNISTGQCMKVMQFTKYSTICKVEM